MRSNIFVALGIALLTTIAAAQESRSEISLQGTGFFTKDATGNGNLQRGSNTGGFLVGYRYHFNRWIAAETVYGYDRNTQQFFAPSSVARIQSNVHQATGGLVVSLPTPRNLRISPYVLSEGGGWCSTQPTTRSAPSRALSARLLECSSMVGVPISPLCGMSPCAPSTAGWSTAHRTLIFVT